MDQMKVLWHPSASFVREFEDTLKDVPAEQVILGVPFYTRVWELTPVTASEDQSDQASDEAQSGYTVSSEVVSMSEVDTRVATNAVTLQWLDDCGQYYAEYEHDGKTYKSGGRSEIHRRKAGCDEK
mgnify:CR=1 FL=1